MGAGVCVWMGGWVVCRWGVVVCLLLVWSVWSNNGQKQARRKEGRKRRTGKDRQVQEGKEQEEGKVEDACVVVCECMWM